MEEKKELEQEEVVGNGVPFVPRRVDVAAGEIPRDGDLVPSPIGYGWIHRGSRKGHPGGAGPGRPSRAVRERLFGLTEKGVKYLEQVLDRGSLDALGMDAVKVLFNHTLPKEAEVAVTGDTEADVDRAAILAAADAMREDL